MSITFNFFTSGSSFEGRLKCWPIEPGSVRIVVDDGNPLTKKVLTDSPDGLGILSGDGAGKIDYSYGWIEADFDSPDPLDGTPILANYNPQEGGCFESCGKCATNKLRLDLSPGSIVGQSSATIASAWARLTKKIERDVLPVHVELIAEIFLESYRWNIGYRFDDIASDVNSLDNGGLRVKYAQEGEVIPLSPVEIYMTATYLISVTPAEIASRKVALTNYCSSFYSIGKDVVWSDLYSWSNSQWPGWLSGNEFAWDINTTGLSDPSTPPSQRTVVINAGQIAVFDPVRMAFVPI
jgi:hypothetical protein